LLFEEIAFSKATQNLIININRTR